MRQEGTAGTNHVSWKFFVRAFSYRNYRLFFSGQSVSLIGTWIQIIAISWLVYRLTNSPLLLGTVAFTTQIPTNAIALNSSMFNVARLIGPSIAGIIIAAAGEGTCFLINSISFLAVIFALLAIKTKSNNLQNKNSHILGDLKDGFIYTFGFATIRPILLLLSLVSILGMSYAILMPIFAKEILGGGSKTLGFLISGLGCIFGSVFLAVNSPLSLEDKGGYYAIRRFKRKTCSF